MKDSNTTAGIQVNKYISSSGYCSRREADAYIAQCRVTINNEIILLGARVHTGDVVAVDGEKIKVKTQNCIYIAFNKPVGVTSTTDTQDKSNIISFINHPKRIFPIGRLDKDSEGLILLTNDGDIVNKILRAGNEHEKEYIVTVEKAITPDFVTRMAGGLNILGEKTKPCKVQQLGGKKFKIILTQGLNRQIRRMCEVLDYHVTSLKRVRIMNIHLADIPTGKWRNLSLVEMEQLQGQLVTSNKTEKTTVAKPKKANKVFDPKKHEAAQYEQKPKPAKKAIAPKKEGGRTSTATKKRATPPKKVANTRKRR
ncbi:MAG: 23S rRNA pseudouridine(2604) synthase RluF [Bacteroidia bacterium]